MTQEWNLPRHAALCGTCGREFEVGASFRVFLSLLDGAFHRDDVCDACPAPAHAGVVGWWRTRRKPPPERRSHAFDREAVYSFFARMEEEAQTDKRRFRFVLALLLWRKKVLKLTDTADRRNEEIWNFVAAHDGKTFAVVRPDLDEAQMEQLSEQLEGLLSESEWPSDSAAPAAAEARRE